MTILRPGKATRSIAACALLLAACEKVGPAGDTGATGPQGPQGPGGPQGAPASATLSWIAPSASFPARDLVVEVAGSGTHFDASTTLDFGDAEVTPAELTVASAAFVKAKVRLTPRARLGPHDVTASTMVSGGAAERAVLQGAFLVSAALVADAQGNSRNAPQGGVVEYAARNLDRDNPLAATGRLGAGARTLHISLFGSHLAGTGIVDALVPPGPLPLAVISGTSGPGVYYSLDAADPNAPRVVPRAPVPLMAGMNRAGEQFAAPGATGFYQVTTAMDEQVLFLAAVTSGPLATAVLTGAVADATGHFSDGQMLYASIIGATQTMMALAPKAGDWFVSLLPATLGGGNGHNYDLLARALPARRFSTMEAMPDTPGAPLADLMLDGTTYSTDGAFDSALDLDYVRVKTARAGRLYVSVVVPGMHLSNPGTSVALMQADCKTVIAAPRPVQQEMAAAAGTTYCARLSSPAGVAAGYTLIVSQGP